MSSLPHKNADIDHRCEDISCGLRFARSHYIWRKLRDTRIWSCACKVGHTLESSLSQLLAAFGGSPLHSSTVSDSEQRTQKAEQPPTFFNFGRAHFTEVRLPSP
ncbi:hypothetical protein GOP47_0023947 [Adiantum capillus-veneris]|uniref:Uncharacterized protein n=1 Tax=Adiantum capillus-veneris TaxID=13818 RepID=A0A9D4U4W3_ADICA|nr:hypothetical protein GOP47_0023947 [Adiantum capillus-veneris]